MGHKSSIADAGPSFLGSWVTGGRSLVRGASWEAYRCHATAAARKSRGVVGGDKLEKEAWEFIAICPATPPSSVRCSPVMVFLPRSDAIWCSASSRAFHRDEDVLIAASVSFDLVRFCFQYTSSKRE